MRTPHPLILPAVALSVLLSSCGQLLAALPPISIGDPMHIGGMALPKTGTMLPMTVGTTHQQAMTVKDLPVDPRSQLPAGAVPRALHVTASLDRATLSGTCDLNRISRFNLTLTHMDVGLSDTNDHVTFSLPAPITTQFVSAGNGTFVADANSATLVFDQVDRVMNVLTSGSDNTVSTSATITSENDLLAGCDVSVTLGASDTKIKF